MLHYENADLKQGLQGKRNWYRNDSRFGTDCAGATAADNKACDEFPDYGSEEGGLYAARRPSIRSINASQNSSESGSRNKRFLAVCNPPLTEGSGRTQTRNASNGSAYMSLPTPATEPLGSAPITFGDLSDPRFGSLSPDLRYGRPLASASNRTFAICARGGGGDGGVS